MSVAAISLNTKCKCNHMFIDHNYSIEKGGGIHFDSCKNDGCECGIFTPVLDKKNELSNPQIYLKPRPINNPHPVRQAV